jgi:integrase
MSKPLREVPWLDKRDGVYTINWCEPAVKDASGAVVAKARTRRLGLRTRDGAEAQSRLAAFLSNGEAFARPSPTSVLTVERALDDYRREHVAAKVVDIARTEVAIANLKDYFAGTALKDIDISACRGYAEARRTGAVARRTGKQMKVRIGGDSTIRRELVVLRAAAGHALRWKRILATEMPTFELPSETERPDEEALWLKPAEVDKLLANSEGRLHHFVKLTYWWGARRGWVEALHVNQVNFDTRRVNPYKPGERVTKKRRRILPIFSQIEPNLRELCDGAAEGFLFGSANADLYRPFHQLCERCGVGDRGHPHVLRHSRATHMLMAGESIYKVAKLLGDTVQTVEKTYGHHSVEWLAEQSAPDMDGLI